MAVTIALLTLTLVAVFALQAFTGLFDGIGQAIGAVGGDGHSDEASSTPSSEWVQGAVPSLYQADPRWAAHPYGDGTVGAAGSAPLCLAMVRIDLTGDVSVEPAEAADLAQQGGYGDDAGSEALLTEGAGLFGLSSRTIDASERAIRRELAAGRPVIASVSSPSFGPGVDHIVLVGIDERSKLEIRDPQSAERTDERWGFDEIIAASSSFHSYDVAR